MRIARVTAIIVALAPWPAMAQPADSWDQPCLERMLDAYVDTPVGHDPAQLPLDTGVKFTENGQRLEPGDSLWRTVPGNNRRPADH